MLQQNIWKTNWFFSMFSSCISPFCKLFGQAIGAHCGLLKWMQSAKVKMFICSMMANTIYFRQLLNNPLGDVDIFSFLVLPYTLVIQAQVNKQFLSFSKKFTYISQDWPEIFWCAVKLSTNIPVQLKWHILPTEA